MGKKDIWDQIGDAVGGAGGSSKNAGGGGGGGSATGSASSGAASVAGGVGTATGTSTGYSAATGGVASVAGAVSGRTAPTPTYSPYQSRSTTTVNLKPLMGTITDPATRALAAPAISAGLKYEVNPSVLLAAASVTDYGRNGKGKGYTNLGDGSEDGAKSIKQAARYLSEAGFHTDPDKAIRRLAKVTGNDPEQIRKTASGYTELDNAARKIEVAEGDTNVTGVGRFKYRKPEDRPSSRVARAARDAASAALNEGRNVDFADLQDVREARRENPAQFDGSTVPQAAAESRGKALNTQGTQLSKRGERQMAKVDAAKTRATANVAEGASALVRALGAEPGPKPRKVAKRLQKSVKRSTDVIVGDQLTEDQKLFAVTLAKEAGFSPQFAAAAVLREGGNGAPGDNNWLNIGAFDSGFDQSIMGDPRFRDPVSAAKLTADFLKGKEFGASEGIQNIYRVAQAGGSDQEVGRAWANSGWASSGASPLDTYDQIQTKPGKDIPKKLIQRANNVLGKPATKALLQGGKLIHDPKAGKKVRINPQKAKWGGAVDAIHAVVPKEFWGAMRGDKRTPSENASVGGASDSDHLTTNTQTFAGDFSVPSEITEEQAWKLARAAAKKLGVPPTGTQTVEKDGYRYQLIWQDEGHYDHVHIGAELIDPNSASQVLAENPNIPIKGTKLAVQPPPPPTTGTTGTSSGGVPTSGTGSPASNLSTAMDAVDKARQGAAAVGGISPITSAAAAYARSSLNNDPTGDPIYEAFRPRR